MDEFRIIRRFFDRQQECTGLTLGIGDDGAVTEPSPHKQVHVIDTLVEGVHFQHDMPASDVGWRTVAVNLSDIAAMGATPRWMTLGLTLPKADPQWLTQFADGLFEAADTYGVKLIGGDTTRGPVTVATIAMIGETDQPIVRSGAQVGDSIYVTGTFGDAAAGLVMFNDGEPCEYLLGRFSRPTPRLDTGRALQGIATAAIDVSDGLVGDLDKLVDASGVGAELYIERVPMSEQLRARFEDDECRYFALLGGDDYELCFTAPAGVDLPGITEIGRVTDSGELVCLLDGNVVEVDQSGYRHFDE